MEPKRRKSLRAVFILGIFISVFSVLGGATLLILSYSKDHLTQPTWKFGQANLFMGIIHLAIYLSLFFLARKHLTKD